MRIKIVEGKKRPKIKYKFLGCGAPITGKTIEAVGAGFVESAYANEPCTYLYFTDGTYCGFVHPCDDEWH